MLRRATRRGAPRPPRPPGPPRQGTSSRGAAPTPGPRRPQGDGARHRAAQCSPPLCLCSGARTQPGASCDRTPSGTCSPPVPRTGDAFAWRPPHRPLARIAATGRPPPSLCCHPRRGCRTWTPPLIRPPRASAVGVQRGRPSRCYSARTLPFARRRPRRLTARPSNNAPAPIRTSSSSGAPVKARDEALEDAVATVGARSGVAPVETSAVGTGAGAGEEAVGTGAGAGEEAVGGGDVPVPVPGARRGRGRLRAGCVRAPVEGPLYATEDQGHGRAASGAPGGADRVRARAGADAGAVGVAVQCRRHGAHGQRSGDRRRTPSDRSRRGTARTSCSPCPPRRPRRCTRSRG